MKGLLQVIVVTNVLGSPGSCPDNALISAEFWQERECLSGRQHPVLLAGMRHSYSNAGNSSPDADLVDDRGRLRAFGLAQW